MTLRAMKSLVKGRSGKFPDNGSKSLLPFHQAPWIKHA
jgi:hypothetical protein